MSTASRGQLLSSAATGALDAHQSEPLAPATPSLAASEASQARPREPALQKPRRPRAKPQQPRGPPSDTREYRGPTLVFTIRTFCEAHHISAAKFHELVAEGRGPRRMRVDRRVYITAEAAAEWRAKQEAETSAAEATATTAAGTAIQAGTPAETAPSLHNADRVPA